MSARSADNQWVSLALGSNLCDPLAQVKQAIEQVQRLPQTQLLAYSSWYRTVAVGVRQQPDFINGAAVITTALDAHSLLQALQAIEQQQGRVRLQHWGPRTLDLDIIDYKGQALCSEHLTLPHPLACQRNFVLQPLLQIHPHLKLNGQPLTYWLNQLDTTALRPLSQPVYFIDRAATAQPPIGAV